MRANIFAVFCFAFGVVAVQFTAAVPAPDTQGNGVIAAPTAAAYENLRNASNKILADLRMVLPQTKTIILYDPNAFAVIPYYASTTDLLRTAASSICSAEGRSFAPRAITPTLDIGLAASGLASLLQLTLPNYVIQGQNLTLDNSALIGSFATAAKDLGLEVVNPSYLLPAVSQNTLNCQSMHNSSSAADLWKFVNSEASAAQPKAESMKPVKDALSAFGKLRDVLLASSANAPPLLGKLLSAESLAVAVQQPASVSVIDMRLDAADIDSTTKTVLWWRKTKFSSNVAAHYWIFSVHGSGTQFGITLAEPGYVNVLRKNVDLKTFTLATH